VFVTNHDRAFGSGEAFPAYLKATPPRPGAELRRRLATRLDVREGRPPRVGTWLSAREQRARSARTLAYDSRFAIAGCRGGRGSASRVAEADEVTGGTPHSLAGAWRDRR
jgi:hypothetical protein